MAGIGFLVEGSGGGCTDEETSRLHGWLQEVAITLSLTHGPGFLQGGGKPKRGALLKRPDR